MYVKEVPNRARFEFWPAWQVLSYCLQWAAVRTAPEEMREPPQKGRRFVLESELWEMSSAVYTPAIHGQAFTCVKKVKTYFFTLLSI